MATITLRSEPMQHGIVPRSFQCLVSFALAGLILSQPVWAKPGGPLSRSVCEATAAFKRDESRTVTIKANVNWTQDAYGYYLGDARCLGKLVAVKFPESYSDESGLRKLIDFTRPDSKDVPVGVYVFCECTGRISYRGSEKFWITVMNIESAGRVWISKNKDGS